MVFIFGSRLDNCHSIIYGMLQANIDLIGYSMFRNCTGCCRGSMDYQLYEYLLRFTLVTANLPVNHCITYKIGLITWKTLHTTQLSYLSELIAHCFSSRFLHSSNTNLLGVFWPDHMASQVVMARYIVLYWMSWYCRHIASYPYRDNSLLNESIFRTTLKGSSTTALLTSATKRAMGGE